MSVDDSTASQDLVCDASDSDRRHRLRRQTPACICRQCATAVFDDESHCPHCHAARPSEGWLHRSEHDDRWLGRVLDDRYLVASPLGAGASAKVYRGEALTIGRVVAIKIVSLRHPHIDRSDLVTRLQREINAVSRLHNPHIVSIYDVLELDRDHAAVVMEFVSGNTLQHVVDTRGPMEPRKACQIARQIANGLSEAHRAGMIHRDIKPENLMVDTLPDGDDFVHILDFGIVRLSETSKASLTQGFIGTPLYASPEQFLERSIDARSDIYSLGGVLFFMLAARPPFPLTNAFQLSAHHIEKPPPRLSVVATAASLPDALDELVQRMLHKEPDRRPSSLDEVLSVLDRIIADTSAPPPQQITPKAMILRPGKLRSRTDDTAQTTLSGDESFAVHETRRDTSLVFVPDHPPRPLKPAVDTEVSALAMSRRHLLTGHRDGIITRTDLEGKDGELIVDIGDREFITAIAVDPDDTIAAVATDTGHISLHDLHTRTRSNQFALDEGLPVTCLAISPESHMLATGRKSGAVDVYSVAGDFVQLFSVQVTGSPRSLSLSPDGYLLLVVLADGSLELYQVPHPAPLSRLSRKGAPIVDVSFTPDGSPLAMASTNGEYQLLHLKNISDVETSIRRRYRHP